MERGEPRMAVQPTKQVGKSPKLTIFWEEELYVITERVNDVVMKIQRNRRTNHALSMWIDKTGRRTSRHHLVLRERDIPAGGWAVRPSRGTVTGDRTRGDGPAVLAAARQ